MSPLIPTFPTLRNRKSGSTQYWAQVQVRGGALPIHSVEVKGIGSSGFVAWKRQDYNYFGAPCKLFLHLQSRPALF